MSVKKKNAGAQEERTVEELISRLEEISEQIQDGNIGLEESIRLYEEGQALAKECEKRLSAAQKKLEVINPNLKRPREGGPEQDIFPDDDSKTLFA